MGLFSRKKPSRQEHLAAAATARARGRVKKAIGEYRKALEEQPDDPATHARLGPLLAKVDDFPGAWASFVSAGEGYFDKSFVDKALAVYVQATQAMPWHPEAWKAVARMHLEKGRRADAFKALVEGRRHFRRRQQRPQAIDLLYIAARIDGDFAVRVDLARLLRKEGRFDEALFLLQKLLRERSGRELRRVRRELFLLSPSTKAAWSWIVGR